MPENPIFCDECDSIMHIKVIGNNVMYQCKCGATKPLPDELLKKYRSKKKKRKPIKVRGKRRESIFDSYDEEELPLYPNDLLLSIKNFDSNIKLQQKIEKGENAEIKFRTKYPYRTNPSLIEDLTEADLYDIPANKYGLFFKQIDFDLKGKLGLNTQQLAKVAEHLEDFKEWLSQAVDDSLSLAEKLEFDWERIPGMGGGHVLGKKIIYAFYEEALPIFNNQHLENFYEKFYGKTPHFFGMSESEQFEFLTFQMIKVKNNHSVMKDWSNVKFMYFLYNYYYPK